MWKAAKLFFQQIVDFSKSVVVEGEVTENHLLTLQPSCVSASVLVAPALESCG